MISKTNYGKQNGKKNVLRNFISNPCAREVEFNRIDRLLYCDVIVRDNNIIHTNHSIVICSVLFTRFLSSLKTIQQHSGLYRFII